MPVLQPTCISMADLGARDLERSFHGYKYVPRPENKEASHSVCSSHRDRAVSLNLSKSY
jgi:hypothetical protein